MSGMMISGELLNILCCPETKQPVSLADQNLLDQINLRIQQGKVSNRSGRPLENPIDAGLICKDGTYLYPIQEGVPILIIDEAIALNEVGRH
ncbi:hypothetical protein H6F97_13140 [Microcoleus sp. FACHB-1]|nr:hypothetical protein [Microcoleus sp. FACHB-1]